MNNFITKIAFQVDIKKMLHDLQQVENQIAWPTQRFTEGGREYHANQIGLTHRPGAELPWYDANGSLYDADKKIFLAREHEFTEWNPVGSYTKTAISELKEKYFLKLGRIRYIAQNWFKYSSGCRSKVSFGTPNFTKSSVFRLHSGR